MQSAIVMLKGVKLLRRAACSRHLCHHLRLAWLHPELPTPNACQQRLRLYRAHRPRPDLHAVVDGSNEHPRMMPIVL